MITIKGQGVCGGVAFGKLYMLKKSANIVKREKIENVQDELERFENARRDTVKQLESLYNKALAEVGEENAMIFEIHQMMLDDADYLQSVRSIIETQKLNAETAVAITADNFAEMFSSMDDSYMQARASDVKDVSERIVAVLSNASNESIDSDVPVIIAAEDLAPSETVQLDKSKILAFITEKGSSSSHTSILARTMNIPAVIGAKGIMDCEENTADTIVDGFTGTVYIDPDMRTVLEMQRKKADADKQKELLRQLKGVKPVTKDGYELLSIR